MIFCKFLIFIFTFSAYSFTDDFQWGVATAPAHVEDGLDDIWLQHGKKGKVAGFKKASLANERVRFWSHPEKEIELAHKVGVGVFRLGIDWGRIEPSPGEYDDKVLKRYHEIFDLIRSRGMKVMLTLFHHSEPKWTLEKGSWENPSMIKDFLSFSKLVTKEYGSKVEWVIPFNEAQVYTLFTKVIGIWPSKSSSLWSFFDFWEKRSFTKSLENITRAHTRYYKWVKEKFPKIKIGVAHNTANYQGVYFYDRWLAEWLSWKLNWYFLDQIAPFTDFIGINYYGGEFFKNFKWHWNPDYNYSDSGRAIDPKGVAKILKNISQKYPQKPIFITENGVADSSDSIRELYIIRHLEVIENLINKGINIQGYIHWTLSDNLEWSDGYCPKFGIISVDRNNQLKRFPRESYWLYQKIIKGKSLDDLKRKAIKKIKELKRQTLCRSKDGQKALAIPREVSFDYKDW